jgi:hypothetical protein
MLGHVVVSFRETSPIHIVVKIPKVYDDGPNEDSTSPKWENIILIFYVSMYRLHVIDFKKSRTIHTSLQCQRNRLFYKQCNSCEVQISIWSYLFLHIDIIMWRCKASHKT